MEFSRHRRKFLAGVTGAMAAGMWPGFAPADSVAGHVLFLRPADNGYADHTALFNKRLVRRPALVAVCFDEAGVQIAVARARSEGLPVAIKSGGHSFEGLSLNDGGFVIDVSAMSGQQLADDGSYMVEPGCRLMQSYEYLVPQGRLLSLGSCGMVGIAGLTLGGGYGLFSRQHGLACDALRGLRIVDAQGAMQEAVPGSELFRACCGGGNGNYGIVTRLQFDTFAAPKQLWRHLFKAHDLDTRRAADCAAAWFDAVPQLPRSAFSAFVLNHRTLTILVTDTDAEMSAEISDVLGRLAKITDKHYPARREALIDGIRRYYGRFAPLNFKNASAGFYAGFADIAPAAPALFSLVTTTPGLLYQVNTMGGMIGDSDDGTRTAYAHRGAMFLAEIQSYWEEPAAEARLSTAVHDVQRLLSHAGVRAHYANYPDLSFQDWASAYYGAAGYLRLRQVKKQYDPDHLFQHAQGVRP
jgi:FAD/FMN-containing dehydrogenase